MGQVLVVGSVNADLVVVVPSLPAAGETVSGGRFERHGGGKGANQAVAAARAGAAVRLVGAVGDDDLGREQLAALAAAGVDVDGVAVLPGVATGVALIAVDAAGENQIAVASGANAEVDAGDLVLEGDGVVLLGHEVPDAAVLAGARAAAAAGWRIVLNPAPARPVPDDVLALGPVLTPNAAEAAVLAGEADPEAAARALAARTGAAVLVTLGGDGVLLLEPDGAPRRLPAPAVDVVDTTGAGDVFNGTLAAALADGAAVADAAQRAVAAAADAVTRPGAR